METILQYLKRKLREAGHARWEQIAVDAGVSSALPRKLAYGDRENPGVQTVQPLLDYFQQVERGARTLPEPRLLATAAPAPAGDEWDGTERRGAGVR